MEDAAAGMDRWVLAQVCKWPGARIYDLAVRGEEMGQRGEAMAGTGMKQQARQVGRAGAGR